MLDLPFLTREFNHPLSWFIGTPLQVAAVVIGAIIVRWVIHRAINRTMIAVESREKSGVTPSSTSPGTPPATDGQKARWRAATGLDDERRRQRAATMGSLFKSITTVVVSVEAVLTIAAQLGIQLGPIMASAGVAGVALGFGAQSLVKRLPLRDLHDRRGSVQCR